MNNLSSLFAYLILTILFAACSRNADPDLNAGLEKQKPKKFSVSRREAMLLPFGTAKNARPGEFANREVEEIADYVDKLSRTIFYAINFKNESGFLLLSADKRLKPILAFSDKGAFNMNSENPGLQLWKDMVAEHFANVVWAVAHWRLEKCSNITTPRSRLTVIHTALPIFRICPLTDHLFVIQTTSTK